MANVALRPRFKICQLCEATLSQQSIRTLSLSSRKPTPPFTLFASQSRNVQLQRKAKQTPKRVSEESNRSTNGLKQSVQHPPRRIPDHRYDSLLAELSTVCKSLCTEDHVPTSGEVLSVLQECHDLAELLMIESQSGSAGSKEGNAASALPSVGDSTKQAPETKVSSLTSQYVAQEISNLAFSIVKHPTVFISPDILQLYVDIQSLLSKPDTLAEVFELYRCKPVPEAGSSPVKYLKANPRKIANAAPPELANKALQVAIRTNQMSKAIDIIESTYTTTAFKRSRFLRQACLPLGVLALVPIAAWTVASRLALTQTTLEQGHATFLAYTGILAYVGFTGTIGFVALTTSNDQMERVTWAAGVPLRERWIREDERAALDKVALAWGFKERWRRGEETGEEWEALKEWCGSKGMILDKVSLMDGME